jgi:hypothetical protein
MAVTILTLPTPITAGKSHLLQNFSFLITQPMARKPLCSQSSSNKMARSIVIGAWMNKASIGRFKVEGYLYNVT